jgi:L-cystine transport system substrate-binding protein
MSSKLGFKRSAAWLFIAIVASVSLLFTACSNQSAVQNTPKSQDTAWSKIKQNGKIVVATSGTLYPDSYHDAKTNKLTGYEVEIVNEMAKRLGLKVDYVEMGFDGMLTSLNTNKVDLVANDVGVTDQRKTKFAFSEPIKHSYGTAIVRKSDLSGIKNIEDLKGKKSAGAATSIYMDISRKLGAQSVVYDNATNEQYLRDVATGRTDVILNDYYLQKIALAYFPKLNITIHPNIRFNPSDSALVMKKDNTGLINNVNKTLKAMLDDGTISKISKQFFAGADVTQKPKMNIPTISTK